MEEQIYRDHVIKIRWDSYGNVYWWEVCKGEEEIGDNSKNYGCDTEQQAIAEAQRHIDWVVDECTEYYFVVQNDKGEYFQCPIDRVKWGELSTAREFNEREIAQLIRNLFGGTVIDLSR